MGERRGDRQKNFSAYFFIIFILTFIFLVMKLDVFARFRFLFVVTTFLRNPAGNKWFWRQQWGTVKDRQSANTF